MIGKRNLKDFYFKLIQEAPDPIIALDRIGNFLFFNSAAEELSTFSKDEVMGKNFANIGILAKESLPRALKEFALVLAGQKRQPFNLNIARKDGSLIPLETHPRLIKTGREIFVQVTLRDISERIKAALILQEREDKYRTLIQTIPDIIYEVDEEGKITFMSDSIKNFGYEPTELIGQHFRAIVHHDDFNEINRLLVLPIYEGKITGDEDSPKLFNERRTRDRMTKNLKFRMLVKNNPKNPKEYCWVELHSSGRWSKENPEKESKLAASIGIMRDVSEQIKAEEAFRQHFKEYEVFYNASRGREERILELKKELRELKDEIKRLKRR